MNSGEEGGEEEEEMGGWGKEAEAAEVMAS